MHFFKAFLFLASLWTFSSFAKNPNQWKEEWVRLSLSLRYSDERSLQQKQKILTFFSEEIAKLQRFQATPQQEQKPNENKYRKSWKFGNWGGVYPRKTLHELEVFLRNLSSLLRDNMRNPWPKIIHEHEGFRNYAKRANKFSHSLIDTINTIDTTNDAVRTGGVIGFWLS